MATLTYMASELIDNAAGVAGTDLDLTEAEVLALGNFLTILAQRKGDSLPLMHLLTDAQKALVTL